MPPRPLALLLLALASCSGTAPTPETVNPTVRLIGPSGGTVNAQGATQGAQLNIPAGALLQDTPVTLGEDPAPPPPPDGYNAAGPSVLCSPEGLAFSRPVTLLVPFSGLSDVQLFTASGAAAQLWAPFDGGTPDEALHLVRASIDHFSRYQAFRSVAPPVPDAGP